MLAKSSPTVPGPDDKGGPFSYEPKWDGFRSIATFDGKDVEFGSRGAKPLTRYFPDLVEVLKKQLPGPCVIDGEIVVRMGQPGGERLAWESLSQRIHPAESRVRKLAEETPASFIAFDLLEVGGTSLLHAPFKERRAKLEKLLAKAKAPLHITQVTDDVELARRWLVEFEGAGLDGVVSKPVDAPVLTGQADDGEDQARAHGGRRAHGLPHPQVRATASARYCWASTGMTTCGWSAASARSRTRSGWS